MTPDNFDHVAARRWLGAPAASHLPVLDKVVTGLSAAEYDFMPNDEFVVLVKTDPSRGMQVYWTELLFRAHFAAATSVLRTRRWLQAVLLHGPGANFTAFAAAYRGFLEAAADTFDVFDNVSWWLAQMHADARLAVQGRMEELTLCPDVENALIHFTHAGYVGRGEDAAETHRAKHTKQYLKGLEGSGFPEVYECYRELSDVAHPGLGSVKCYAGPLSSGRTGYRLVCDQDADLIGSFCDKYQKVTERTMFFGVVPPILVLRVLNELPIEPLHTPTLWDAGVERHPAWFPLAARLKDPRRLHETNERMQFKPA